MQTRPMARWLLSALLVGASAASVACDKTPETSTVKPAAEQSAKQAQATEAQPAEQAAGSKKVSVAKDGTKFDPPVKKEQIPDGAWICDMGTVHYARMEPGDGKCPTCGMKLVEHGKAKAHAHSEE